MVEIESSYLKSVFAKLDKFSKLEDVKPDEVVGLIKRVFGQGENS